MYSNNNNNKNGGSGGSGGGDTGTGRSVEPDEMHVYGNAASRLSSMGVGGGQGVGGGSSFSQDQHPTIAAMMGMNANNMSTIGGMNNISSMNSMSGTGNSGMSAGIPDMDMLAVYRANENMVMMNEHRAAILQGRNGDGVNDQLLPPYQNLLGNMSSGDGGNRLSSYLEGSGTLGLMSNNVDIGIAAAQKHRTMDDEAISASMKTRKRRKKSKKDSDMPRRALSAYNIFFSEQREKILEEIDLKRQKGKMKAESNDDTDKEEKEDDNSTVVEESKPKKGGRDHTDEDESNSAKKKSSLEKEDEEEDSGSKQERNGEKTKKERTKGEAKEENEEKEENKKIKNKECNEEDEGDNEVVDSGPTVMTRSFFPAKTKRAHRKVHGKIGLVELAREVSKRWKVLDPESRSHYDGLAEEDRKRHKQVMAEYHQRKAAENMVNMGRKEKEDEGVASKNDIPETITHHHQQRIVAEMMTRQAHTGDPMLTMGTYSPSMGISSRFRDGNMNPMQGGGICNMQDIRDIQDMEAVLHLQNQRALMMQRMRMSGVGGMGTDTSGRSGMDMGDSGDRSGMGGGSSGGVGRGTG